MMEATLCEHCDHVDARSREKPPYMWTCLQHPCLEGFGFVSETQWARGEPYLRCSAVNGGLCKLFKKRVEGQQDNGL